MRRTKFIARRSCIVTASSSSSEEDISLGASQEEALAPSTDAPSSGTVSQRRGGVDFAAESIHPQGRGTVEGQPFNASLLRF